MASDNARRLNEFIHQHHTILFVASKKRHFDTLPACWALAEVARSLHRRTKVFFPGTLPTQLSFLGFENVMADADGDPTQYTVSVRASNRHIEHVQYLKRGPGVHLLLLDENDSVIPAGALSVETPTTHFSGVVVVGTTALDDLPPEVRHSVEQERTSVLFIAPRVPPEGRDKGNVLSDERATSCSELATRVIKELDEEHITPPVATALLTGLIAATQNFQQASLRPQTLFAAAYLIGRAADKNTIIRHLYKTKPFSFIKLWGYALARFSYDPRTRIGSTYVDASDFTRSGATRSQAGMLLVELKNNFSQADTFVLGVEQSAGTFVAFVHAPDTDLLNRYARRFGTHPRTATILISLPHRRDLAKELQALVAELQRIVL